MRRITLSALLTVILALAAVAPAQPADLRRETFDTVWRIIKEKHFDPNFGGVNWDQVRERYSPRVQTVKSDQELYILLQQMLGELKQSHFNIIPPEAIVEDEHQPTGEGAIGVTVSFTDGAALITRVEADSNAARAGLRPGFVIKQVDQTPVEQIAARFAKSKEPAAIISTRISRVIAARISGKPGTPVRLVYLDERDRAREAVIERVEFKGEMSPRFGNFPPQYIEFESRRLAGGVGYIRFNIFVIPLMERIRRAIREMNDAPGIIFDLRGNPGGLGGMSSGIAGLLEARQTSLGTSRMRAGYQNFAVFPQSNPYGGRVVVLIDNGSASTSEVFAAGMQENGRAVIVGERSAGAVLLSVFEKLPTGAIFQYAIADYKTPKGVLIEGRGVMPDVEVKLDRAGLLSGRDPQIEQAVKQILKGARAKARAGA